MIDPWPSIPLGDLVEGGELSYGVVQPGSDQARGVPIVRVKDLGAGRVDTSAPMRVATDVSNRHSRTVLRGGELLISIVGTIGESAVVSPELAGWNVARAIAVIRPEGVSAHWLRLALQTRGVKEAIEGVLNTTVQATLNLSDLKRLAIPMPPEQVRQAIGEVVGALDDKIAANDRALQASAQLGRAILMRDSANGTPIPICEAASMITRGVTPAYVLDGGLRVVNQKCVRDQFIDLRQSRMMSPSTQSRRKLLQCNDLLVNSTGQGTLGRVARWTFDTIEATVDTHVTIVRFSEAVVDPVCAGVAALALERQIELLAEGSTGQTELRRDLLGNLHLRLPPLDLQRKLGIKLRSLDKLAMALRAENTRLAETRDELLPLLMSGRVHVKDATKVLEAAL